MLMEHNDRLFMALAIIAGLVSTALIALMLFSL
jgi:hypothetical protein